MSVITRIYTVCVRPVMTYGHPLLLSANLAYLESFLKTERRALRIIRRTPIKTSNRVLNYLRTFPSLNDFLAHLTNRYAANSRNRPVLIEFAHAFNRSQTKYPSLHHTNKSPARNPAQLIHNLDTQYPLHFFLTRLIFAGLSGLRICSLSLCSALSHSHNPVSPLSSLPFSLSPFYILFLTYFNHTYTADTVMSTTTSMLPFLHLYNNMPPIP